MKILLINTYDKGGAAKACMRLYEGLLQQGIDARLLILFSKKSYPENGKIAVFSKQFPYMYEKPNLLKRFALKAGMGKKTERIKKEIEHIPKSQLELFTYPYTNYDITLHPWYKESDIINLHWTSGFLDYSFFSKNLKPVIWTLHDMNAFTGGCHYSQECYKFMEDCASCHYLRNTINPNFARKLFKYKNHHLNNVPYLHIACPSQWLAKISHSSTLFKRFDHSVIPYGIDTNIFKAYPKEVARKLFGLPLNKKILLFAAQNIDNPRKGINYIFDVIDRLKNNSDVIICAVGKANINKPYKNLLLLGEIDSEEKMAMAYNASDALLIPSLEDNLPNTALESILCGTPVIAFPVGGLLDIINDEENGYLCPDISSQSLTKKTIQFLENNVHLTRDQIRTQAVANYDILISANRYITLYKSIFQNKD